MPPRPNPEKQTGLSRAIDRFGLSLSAIDKITLAYCAWFVIYSMIGISIGRAEKPMIPILGHMAIASLVLLLAWIERKANFSDKPKFLGALRFVRSIYPIIFFDFFYTSIYSVSRIMFPNWLDPWFMELDRKIFGYFPSLEWGQRYNHWFVQEFFHFAYFCYYPMIGGLPLYLYIKNKPAFREVIFNLTFVFYSCYIFYSLIPVVGGRILTEGYELSQTYQGGLFTHIMAYIYSHSSHWGGAFPSSHVAIAIVLTIAALKFTRKWGYVFCVISLFLSIATVYCHYHWFVDALAGIITGISGYFVGNWIRNKLQRELI